MPIDYFKPINSLRSISGSGLKPYSSPMTHQSIPSDDDSGEAQLYPDDQANDDLELLSLQTQRKNELEMNAAKGLAMAHPAASFRSLDSDIKANPITHQAGQVKDYLDKARAAQNEGFATPQEQAGYGRNLAEEKLRQPIEAEKIKGEFGLKEQESRNKGALDVANVNTNYRDAQLEAFKTLISGGGLRPGGRASLSGVGSISNPAEKPVPSTLLTQVQKARVAAEKSKGFWNPKGGNNEQANLQSSIATALSQHPASPQVKAFAQELAKHPRTSKAPLDQIMNDVDLSDFSPEDVDSLGDILGIIRGF